MSHAQYPSGFLREQVRFAFPENITYKWWGREKSTSNNDCVAFMDLVIKMSGNFFDLAHGVVHEAAALTTVMQRQPLSGFVFANERRRLHSRVGKFQIFVQVVQTYTNPTVRWNMFVDRPFVVLSKRTTVWRDRVYGLMRTICFKWKRARRNYYC